MPLKGLAIDIDGVERTLFRLKRTRIRLGDLRPAFNEIIDEFASINKQAFAQGGHPGLGAWEPLNENYVAFKAAHGFSTRILVKTGRLEASLTQPDHSEFIKRKHKKSLVLGTEVPYAAKHQTGDGVIQREPVRVTPKLKRFASKAIERHIIGR